MRCIYGLFFLLLFYLAGCHSAKENRTTVEKLHSKPTEVQVLSTIHKHHLTNPKYPYSKVTQLIKKFDPDLIGVEIRPEDIMADSVYLAQFYPLEMRQVLKDFPPEKIIGFDWYGEEMRGKRMPADVFKNEQTELGQIKKLEREMNQDTSLAPKLLPLAELSKKQVEIVKTHSPAELNNGEYDNITATFYTILNAALTGTEYEKYAAFNRQRDIEISGNIVKLVEENPGKRIIFLLGANHHGPAVTALQKRFGNHIKTVVVSE